MQWCELPTRKKALFVTTYWISAFILGKFKQSSLLKYTENLLIFKIPNGKIKGFVDLYYLCGESFSDVSWSQRIFSELLKYWVHKTVKDYAHLLANKFLNKNKWVLHIHYIPDNKVFNSLIYHSLSLKTLYSNLKNVSQQNCKRSISPPHLFM